MLNLNDICYKILETNSKINVVGVIEAESALLLGYASESEKYSLEYCETLSAALVNMFRGRNIKTIETMIAQMRNQRPVNTIEKIRLVMDKNNVLAVNNIQIPEFLLFYVTEIDADIEYITASIADDSKLLSTGLP